MKLVFVITLAVVIVVLAVLLVVMSKSQPPSKETRHELLKVIKAITTGLLILVGAGTTAGLLSGCVAKRSITVQGSIIKNSPDSTRIIISSQESYSGVKK